MGTLSITDPVNGTANDATTIANANAAIKAVVNGNIDTVNLKDPGTGKVYGSTGAGAAASVYPPGYEIVYAETTASVSVVSLTESASTTILAAANTAFDGTAVVVYFSTPGVSMPTNAAGDSVILSLFDGSTQVTRMAQPQTPSVTAGAILSGESQYRFTPSAGTHTYSVRAYASSTAGTPQVLAGAGGTATRRPAFLRITKV